MIFRKYQLFRNSFQREVLKFFGGVGSPSVHVLLLLVNKESDLGLLQFRIEHGGNSKKR